MPSLDKASAQTILDPILATIEQCIQESWGEWSDFYAPKHHILDARARAAIVYCHTVDRAMVLFRDVPGVQSGRKRGIFRLFVGDDIALRFKKAKKNGTTSNVSTGQQRLIDLQLTIPGILPGTMLNAVYQLDDLQRDISRMMVTHQLAGKIIWSIEIKAPPSEPTAMLAPQAPTGPTPSRARIKGKRIEKKASSQGA
jgi:hypothetical protein